MFSHHLLIALFVFILNCLFPTSAIQCLHTSSGYPVNNRSDNGVCFLNISWSINNGCSNPGISYQLLPIGKSVSKVKRAITFLKKRKPVPRPENIPFEVSHHADRFTCSFRSLKDWQLNGSLNQFERLLSQCMTNSHSIVPGSCRNTILAIAKNAMFVKRGKLDPAKVKAVRPNSQSSINLMFNVLIVGVFYFAM